MKARSLYHLLMARLRQLDGSSEPEAATLSKQLRDSLSVDQAGQWFQLRWSWNSKRYELDLPGDTFSFYLRGDTAKPEISTNVREQNWEQAEAVLRRMAEISSTTLPANPQSSSLSVLTFDDKPSEGMRFERIALMSVTAGLLSCPVVGLSAAALTTAAALALCFCYSFQRGTLLRRPVGWAEYAIVASGPVLAVAFDTVPLGAAILAGGLGLLAWAESEDRNHAVLLWAAGGAVLGATVIAAGVAAWAPVVSTVLLVAFLHLLVPARIPRAAALVMSAAGILAALLFSNVTLLELQPLGASFTPAYKAASLLTGFAAVLCFALWWVVGSQGWILPWVVFAAIAAAAVALYAMGSGQPLTGGSLAFAGYLLCSVGRLLHAFSLSRTAKEVER